MISILTTKGESIAVAKGAVVTTLKKKTVYPHWGWWVLVLLLCWPLVVALCFMGKEVYEVDINGEVVELDPIEYQTLMSFWKGCVEL